MAAVGCENEHELCDENEFLRKKRLLLESRGDTHADFFVRGNEGVV